MTRRRLQKTLAFISIFMLLLILSSITVAADTAVVNSRDWVDVYSVLLNEAQNNRRAFFLNSDIITSLTKIMSKDDVVQVYEPDDAFLNNLHRQLESVGYDAQLLTDSSSLNLDLDPQNGNYYLISRDNPRISISLASLAVKENAWVLVVDDDTVEEVADRIALAQSAVAVGNFKRELIDQIRPFITDEINNNDVFLDSQEIALRYGIDGNVILADGAFLETEFFLSENPVMLSGHNKILDQTYDFLEENDVSAVVIVGNELSVVGEQIRERSKKEISVFVKFGQSDTANSGKVYALTMFPLPKPLLALTVKQALYDPAKQQLVATFENLGNAGIYEITSITVKNTDDETIGTASDEEVVYIAAGESLPITFEVNLPTNQLEGAYVEFFTSFGLYPSELDTFLTMQNRFGPPFSIPLTLADLEEDPSKITITDVTYFTNLKRVAVTVLNEGDNEVFYTLKINGLIVNGLEEDFFKRDSVNPLEEKVTYIPVELDEIDLEENTEFNLAVTYGQNEDLLLNNVNLKYPFKYSSSGIFSGLATKVGGTGSLIVVVIVLVLIVLGVLFFRKGRGGERQTRLPRGPPPKRSRPAPPVKKSAVTKKTTKKTTKTTRRR